MTVQRTSIEGNSIVYYSSLIWPDLRKSTLNQVSSLVTSPITEPPDTNRHETKDSIKIKSVENRVWEQHSKN